MSNMFNYDDESEIYQQAMKWDAIEDPRTQNYALKYILGRIDLERSRFASTKDKGGDVSGIDRRLGMLKKLAGTLARLPIPAKENL